MTRYFVSYSLTGAATKSLGFGNSVLEADGSVGSMEDIEWIQSKIEEAEGMPIGTKAIILNVQVLPIG